MIPSLLFSRLYHQQLIDPRFETPEDVVAWLGAVQAQEYAGGKWAVGLRLPKGTNGVADVATDAVVEKAIAERKIVRTWLMRGTLHFVTPVDIGWMLDLVAERIIAANARRFRELELDMPTLNRAAHLIAQTLADGALHTRKALMAMLEQNGILTTGQRAPYLLQYTSMVEPVCQGVSTRNDAGFLLLDALLPGRSHLPREEAAAALAMRYFNSRGPATLRDFAWWSGLPIRQARAALEAVKGEFVETVVDDQTYWSTPGDVLQHGGAALAHLLPAYDEFLIGYADRSAALDPENARMVQQGNGFSPTIIIDGKVNGIWKRTLHKDHMTVHARLARMLSPREDQELMTAARRFSNFLGVPAVLQSVYN